MNVPVPGEMGSHHDSLVTFIAAGGVGWLLEQQEAPNGR